MRPVALSNANPSQVIQLHARRDVREAASAVRAIDAELRFVRDRLLALTSAGGLFEAHGSREGRTLLGAQDLLFAALAHLRERSGEGALPAPRLETTRERLLLQAREKLARARRRLGREEAGGRLEAHR